MKFAHETPHPELAYRLNAKEHGSMETALSGYAFHPVRRASDTCPISSEPDADERPPTSPKMHELRERMLAEMASASRSSRPPKNKL